MCVCVFAALQKQSVLTRKPVLLDLDSFLISSFSRLKSGMETSKAEAGKQQEPAQAGKTQKPRNHETRKLRKPRKSQKPRNTTIQRKPREQRKPRKRENCESRENHENVKTVKTQKPREQENGTSTSAGRICWLSLFLAFLVFAVSDFSVFSVFSVFWFSHFYASHRSGHDAKISCLVETSHIGRCTVPFSTMGIYILQSKLIVNHRKSSALDGWNRGDNRWPQG